MKNWASVEVVDGVPYRLKIFKSESRTGYELLFVNDKLGTYEVIDADDSRNKLVDARSEYSSLLKDLHHNIQLKVDTSWDRG